jgi:hypothetical protein
MMLYRVRDNLRFVTCVRQTSRTCCRVRVTQGMEDRVVEDKMRARAFGLVAEGVAAGLSAPWRVYLARGCRYLALSVGDRTEWDSWRVHLGCPDLTVRIYEVGGDMRRSSVAEVVRDGCRISVELLEDISVNDLGTLQTSGEASR